MNWTVSAAINKIIGFLINPPNELLEINRVNKAIDI